MLNPDMMTTDAFVKLAFNSAELSLNVEQLESIAVAVHMNVSMLQEQYTPRGGDQSAFPFEAASMLVRVIGPLGTQVRSVYDRDVALWGLLLIHILLFSHSRSIQIYRDATSPKRNSRPYGSSYRPRGRPACKRDQQ